MATEVTLSFLNGNKCIVPDCETTRQLRTIAAKHLDVFYPQVILLLESDFSTILRDEETLSNNSGSDSEDCAFSSVEAKPPSNVIAVASADPSWRTSAKEGGNFDMNSLSRIISQHAHVGDVEGVKKAMILANDLEFKGQWLIDNELRMASFIDTDVKRISGLLEAGANPVSKDSFGNSALNNAVTTGNVKAVEQFMKSGSVNQNDFIRASRYSGLKEEMVEYLRNSGIMDLQ